MATLNPLPSAPRRWSAGTRTFSKCTGVVEDPRMPSFFSSGPTWIPPISLVTAKAETRFSLRPRTSTSVWAKTVKKSAMPPLVTHCLDPLST